MMLETKKKVSDIQHIVSHLCSTKHDYRDIRSRGVFYLSVFKRDRLRTMFHRWHIEIESLYISKDTEPTSGSFIPRRGLQNKPVRYQEY